MHFRLTLDQGLPVADLKRIDAVCDQFEAGWRNRERPDLEPLLLDFAGPARLQLLRDLLALELDLRLKLGEKPDRDDYRERFPGHDDVIDAVFGSRGKTDHPPPGPDPRVSTDPTVDGTGKDGPTLDAPETDKQSRIGPAKRGSPAGRPGGPDLAGYEILEELGRGGMGIVYKARQSALNRMVALKIIRSAEFASDAELIRFQNEAEAVAHLDHPHIVPIYEVGHSSGRRFFSMKLVAGRSLDRKLGDFAADFRAAARLVATIAGAIDHAHQRGILHRDLKPANILVDGQGEPHVTDFGLARRIDTGSDLTHSGYPVGTPSYMSPEQARGDKGSLTTATDVYGLGSILYALLTGNAPFVGSSLAETLDKVRAAAPEPPTRLNARVPRDLEIICLKCLEKDPQRRYASARLLADDLNRWLGGKPIEARPVGSATRAWMWCRRNPLPAGLAALCVLAIVVGLAGITWKWREADVARDLAETTNAFLLNKLFDQASPRFNPRGASLTVGELLDRASSRLKSEFEGRPEVEAAIRRTLGSAYLFLSRHDQATLHFEEAIKLDSQLHGPHHRQTLRDVNLLTSSLDDAARYSEAESLARRNLEDCKSWLGPRDATTLDAESQYAVVLSHLGKLDKAESLLRDCVQAQRQVHGAQHPDTLRSINLLGLLLQDRGKLDEADELALEYEHGIRCLFGTKHPDNVTALAGRGRVRLNQGRLDEAELLYETAAAESSRILGADHPRTLAALDDHARVLQRNGKTHDAQRVLREAWELARSGRGLDDPETLKAGCRHARALIDGGNAQEAQRVLGLILPRCKIVLGPVHPVTREANELVSHAAEITRLKSAIPADPFDLPR